MSVFVYVDIHLRAQGFHLFTDDPASHLAAGELADLASKRQRTFSMASINIPQLGSGFVQGSPTDVFY